MGEDDRPVQAWRQGLVLDGAADTLAPMNERGVGWLTLPWVIAFMRWERPREDWEQVFR